MRSNAIRNGFLIAGMAIVGALAVRAQTDAALSLYGAFTGTTTGNNVQQSPSNAAGGIVELRHIRNPLIGYEATYSYNRANQVYSYSSIAVPATGSVCASPCIAPSDVPTSVSASAHEITGDWVASVKVANLRPFALAGVGVIFDVPVSSSTGATSTTTKPVYVYGGGIDWGLLPHLGLRFQYRGNLYQAPNLSKLYTSVDAFTHTAEPMIGVYFRL